jgi:hypothetical protein
VNKDKWDDKNDKAHELIGMFIYSYLWFHLQGIDGPDEAWEKMAIIFGKHNEI